MRPTFNALAPSNLRDRTLPPSQRLTVFPVIILNTFGAESSKLEVKSFSRTIRLTIRPVLAGTVPFFRLYPSVRPG